MSTEKFREHIKKSKDNALARMYWLGDFANAEQLELLFDEAKQRGISLLDAATCAAFGHTELFAVKHSDNGVSICARCGKHC